MDARDPNELKLILPRSYVSGPGHTLYILDPESTPQYFIAKSRFDQYGGPCITSDVSVYTAVPAIPLVDLDTLFTPPFSLR